MKLKSPTIYVLHKVHGEWARSEFRFDGLVDRRRVLREIVRAFKRGGEAVDNTYIEACINSSLEAGKIKCTGTSNNKKLEDINIAERYAQETD